MTRSTAVRTAVVLAAHGCGDESNANRRVREIAAQVSARTGLETVAGFNLGTPGWAEAIDGLEAQRVVVVPLMTSDGFFVREVLPERCRGASSAGSRELVFAGPVGMREVVVGAVVERVARTVGELGVDAARATVLVVGHGTRRNPASGDSTRELASRIGARLGGADARAVFLDQDPLLEDVGPTLGAGDVVVVAYLLGGGDHAEVDITERLGLEVDGPPPRVVEEGVRRFIFEPPLLEDPSLADAIVEAVR